MFSNCNDSVVKITPICQCYFMLTGLNGHSTDVVNQIIKWDNRMVCYCFILLF